ncbi:response regulator [Stella sp.]|uniref:response regulator n=1 Tax=Stella sp. TaxID=2912054 RepID=UPI0035B15474
MASEGIAGARILIVEDEAMIAMLLEDMLEEMGCRVVATAGTLDEAMAAVGAEPALDLAILDVNLGGAETYPVADLLRRRGIPYIFSTGYGVGTLHPDHQDRPTLSKPFVESELLRCLDQALGRTPL